MPYRINEIFTSIQGEGVNTGMPCCFIRFAGCNLKCEYCDTDHNPKISLATPKAVIRYIEGIAHVPEHIRAVVLTGGEPLLQLDAKLMTELSKRFHYICIETNGTVPFLPGTDDVIADMHLTISPKRGQNVEWNRSLVPNEIKVVDEGQNLEEYMEFYGDDVCYYLQPKCPPEHQFFTFREIMIRTAQRVIENPGWNLSLQTHKWIGIR